jgi:hypothetical protein
MKKALAMIVISSALFCSGCSTAWIGEAEQIVSVLVPASTNLVTLAATLQGSVSPADLHTIQAADTQVESDLQLMQSLIAQYQKAEAATQPGLLGQIQAATTGTQSELSGILPSLHIKDAATQAKISAVVGLLLSEVQSMAAIVPLVKPGPSTARMSLAPTQIRQQPPLTAGEFVSSYNALMTAKTGNIELDRATSGLRIHAHGKLARWASAGLLK